MKQFLHRIFGHTWVTVSAAYIGPERGVLGSMQGEGTSVIQRCACGELNSHGFPGRHEAMLREFAATVPDKPITDTDLFGDRLKAERDTRK